MSAKMSPQGSSEPAQIKVVVVSDCSRCPKPSAKERCSCVAAKVDGNRRAADGSGCSGILLQWSKVILQ